MIALRDPDTFNNPTIVIIVDREDLDTQTAELFATAKKFLHESDVRSIESRADMAKTLGDRPSGGVYITSIQKFCEKTGLLSDRSNIICISDEAHRTQTGVGAKLKKTDKGVFTTYGFAKYLRDSFPNATYCGFTGTPVDETIAVFGDVVDSYTMKESSDDGITVRIAYEPRLARVILSDEQAKEIQKYYDRCAEQGSTQEQIEESQRAMAQMRAILGHPDRLKKLAADIVLHYEALCAEKPEIIQKAMIVCSDRAVAFHLLQEILAVRPEWGEKHRAEDESALTEEQLDKLMPLPKINLVATQGANDKKDLFDACGTKTRFLGLSRRLKGAYTICFPSGELTDVETTKAQFYLAIRSIIYKQTKGDAPDAEIMNRVVEEMVRNAIACTGIENIVDENKSVDLFSDEFIAELDAVKMPITKFNDLLKLLRKAISSYGRTNKVKAQEFDERLRNVVEAYNSRDKLVFTSEVVADFVNDLSDQLLQILKDLQDDKTSFEKLGISFEEKAFYDILVKVRDDHGFPYADEKCLVLAKKIKELVDDKAQFADWSTRDDIKNQLNMELTVLLYQNGYPPEWDEEVFEKVMEQAENFKKYSDK